MSIGVMLFNPYTGQPRHPSDIESDPRGVLIWDGEEPLKAAIADPLPPQRQWVDLSPENIVTLLEEHNLYGSKLVELIRATESKSKEKNNGN